MKARRLQIIGTDVSLDKYPYGEVFEFEKGRGEDLREGYK